MTFSNGTRRLLPYAMAALAVALSIAIHLASPPWSGPSVRLGQFFPAILIAAAWGGMGAGLFATLLSSIAAVVLLPRQGVLLANPGDYVWLAIFIASGVSVAELNQRVRRVSERATSRAIALDSAASRIATAADMAARAQQRLVDVVAHVPAVVWETWAQPDARAQRIDFVSDYVERLLGYTPQEWLATPDFWLTVVHPDDRERALAEARAIFDSGVGGMSVFRWVARDGRVFWVESQSRVILDATGQPVGVRGVNTDISTRKQLEEEHDALLDEAKFLSDVSRMMAETLEPDATLDRVARLIVPRLADFCVIVVAGEADDDICVAACAHVDPSQELVLRQVTNTMVSTPSLRNQSLTVKALRTGVAIPSGSPPGVVADIAPDVAETIAPLDLESYLAIPLTARGRRLGALSVGRRRGSRPYSARERTLTEEVAVRAAMALDNARLFEHAQQTNRVKDEFLATLSHELRTPINAVLGWAQMLRAGIVTGPRAANALEAIERNAGAQHRLIEELLDVSRIITGKFRLEVEDVDLRALIDAAVEAVRPAAEAKRLALTVNASPLPPYRGDPHRLQQAIWNLLSNAVKFTPVGGSIRVEASLKEDQLELLVSDTGEGIASPILPHVFERFHQGDSSTTREHTGLGLGLAIVRHIVELHGGTIQAHSEGRDRGASFRVLLPAEATSRAGYLRPAIEGDIAIPTTRLDGVRVLIVDDNVDALEMLQVLLAKYGASVVTASSANEALTTIHDNEAAPFEFLLSDIEMPGRDGYWLIQSIRARENALRQAPIPAAAVTAYVRAEDRDRALRAGFNMHIGKPLDVAELVSAIATRVRNSGVQLH